MEQILQNDFFQGLFENPDFLNATQELMAGQKNFMDVMQIALRPRSRDLTDEEKKLYGPLRELVPQVMNQMDEFKTLVEENKEDINEGLNSFVNLSLEEKSDAVTTVGQDLLQQYAVYMRQQRQLGVVDVQTIILHFLQVEEQDLKPLPSICDQLPRFENVDEECSICLEKNKVTFVRLPCLHAFGETCILTWLRARPSCPLCRTPLESRTPLSVQESPNEDCLAS